VPIGSETRPRRQRAAFGPLVVDYDHRVLTPRPWTLLQSEWAAELAGAAEPGPLLELCAGAGYIGLAAAVLCGRDLVQVEADPVAADYAVRNARRAGFEQHVDVRVARLEQALDPGERFPLVIADPPYLPSIDVPRWPDDPPTAIDGGPDGLRVMRRCLELAAAHLTGRGQLLLQTAGRSQNAAVEALAGARPELRLRVAGGRAHDEQRSVLLLARR
jgi:methylase of polypeptide subunit release factors